MRFCDSGHLQNEHVRPDMELKYMNTGKTQWKEPELTTLISGGEGRTQELFKGDG